MDQVLAALNSAWQILLIGTLLGAGLPTLFAIGIKILAWGAGGDASEHALGDVPKAHLAGRLLAYLIFAVVILVVLIGIGYIAAHGLGWKISFDGIMPVFTHK